ncbi:MAG: preprotein translocase subunit SecE [Gammaproteobacteria bacterium]|nr:preprotein translocase subunit SecE [Gammaproteobacteria bacterium]
MSTHDLLMDRIKRAAAFLSLAIGIALFYYLSDEALLYRVLAILAMVIVAVVLFFLTESGRNTANFLQGAQVELQKTVWPAKAETIHTTLLIFAVVFIVALFLWALDLFLAWFMQIIIK